MDVVARAGRSRRVAPKFCSSCGSPLEADAAFCANCGEGQLAARRINLMPQFGTIPRSVWVAALEVFFTLTTLVVAASGLIAAISTTQSLPAQPGGAVSAITLWLLLLVQLSIQVTLVPGFLAQRRWARALYMWTLLPIVLVTLAVVLQGEALRSTPAIAIGAAWVGLTVLQAILVIRHEADYSN